MVKLTELKKKASKIYSNKLSNDKKRAQKGYHALISDWDKKDFINWYKEQEKKCDYCGLTEEEGHTFNNNPIYSDSKRKKYRGNSLEIDRKDDKPYSRINCVLACYWCNNAKSDVFSYDDFKPIGIQIGRRIRKILMKNK